MRSPAMLSGIVTTASQFSLITSFGNYVAAPGSGPVHISVNGQGRYANLERDTTVGAISANTVLKVPEIVVDDDAKFTFLNNHPAFQSDTAAVFYQAGSQGMNNHDFALYSNTLYPKLFTSVIPGGWNFWTYNGLPITLWPSLPVQITNIDQAPSGQSFLDEVSVDIYIDKNGDLRRTDVYICPTRPLPDG